MNDPSLLPLLNPAQASVQTLEAVAAVSLALANGTGREPSAEAFEILAKMMANKIKRQAKQEATGGTRPHIGPRDE